MTVGPHGEVVIETLGDLADHGMGIIWSCDDCNRTLDLSIAQAIEIWGSDQPYIRWHPPIRCAGCGSRDVSGRVQADVTPPSFNGTPYENGG